MTTLAAIAEWDRDIGKKSPVQVESKSVDPREVLRQRYRPAQVRLLFVGEAPPASGLFFYRADSGLFRAIRKAFIAAFPALRSGDFLKSFQELECYLVDLCGTSVDRLDKEERRRVCLQSEVRLARIIKRLQPKTIITVVRSISPHVERAQQQADWMGLHVSLPYPGRWRHHQVAFEKALSPILRKQLSKPAVNALRHCQRQSALCRKS